MNILSYRPTGLAMLVLVSVAVAACDDDPLPTGHDDDGDPTEDLQVELTLSPDHVHIYSDVTFTAVARDHHQDPVTDFEHIHLEYREASESEWSEVELTLDGDAYTATHTFESSGDYDIRVTGQRPEDASAVVMHEMAAPLHAARAHATAGGYTVEFEAFPGHLHAGDTGTLRFWIADESGGGEDPVTELSPEVHVTESDGAESTHAAAEGDPGVYEADHDFVNGGEATVALHFTGSSDESAEAPFTIEISHAH